MDRVAVTGTITSDFDKFSALPLSVLYADISSNAVRLFAVLMDYANKDNRAWPSRETLRQDLHLGSVDTVDRALAELKKLGAVQVVRQGGIKGQARRSNVYKLGRPSRTDAGRPSRTRAVRMRPTLNETETQRASES